MDTTTFSIFVKVIMILALLYQLFVINRLRLQITMLEDENERRENKNGIKYSQDVLDFIKNLVSQIAIIRFREFQDTHDFQKVTKHMIENLSKDVAIAVHAALNKDNLMEGTTMISRDFYDEYIILLSIMLTKDLFEKTLDNMEEM